MDAVIQLHLTKQNTVIMQPHLTPWVIFDPESVNQTFLFIYYGYLYSTVNLRSAFRHTHIHTYSTFTSVPALRELTIEGF